MTPSPAPRPAPDRPRATHYDVIVVGARPAGAATARLLAGHGLRTLVLDAGRIGSDTRSTHALMRAGVLQLSRWGLLDRIIAAGTPPVRRTTFTYGADRAVITIRPSAGVDALYAPRRTVLDPLLVAAAREAGAEVVDRTPVAGLLRSGGRVTGVRAVPGGGRAGVPAIDIGARLVIGADGTGSMVARQVAAPVTRRATHTTAVTYGYWDEVDTDGYQWIFRPDGCAGLIPTNDGRTVVFAAATPARIGRGGARLIEAAVVAGAPDLADQLRLGRGPTATRTWPGQPGFLRRAGGPGWALVGDAGSFKDPISAHGLTDALRDAELLARAVLAGWPLSDDDALAGYEAERDRLSIPLLDIADRIASQRWSDTEISDLLLGLSSAMADEVEALTGLEPLTPPVNPSTPDLEIAS